MVRAYGFFFRFSFPTEAYNSYFVYILEEEIASVEYPPYQISDTLLRLGPPFLLRFFLRLSITYVSVVLRWPGNSDKTQSLNSEKLGMKIRD